MRTDRRSAQKADKKAPPRGHKRGVVGYSKKSALLEEAITHMNSGKYGRSSAALKELLALDPHNTEARRLFATLHLKLGSLVTARQAFESLANEAIGRQDYWLAESLLREYLAAGPRCVPFLELLAHVYQEKGDEMAAVAELGKAIEILRDDPDSDNPQKAAEFYAKIRQLAPASSVALELAPLFDVQTGEFLVRPASREAPALSPEGSRQESAPSTTEQPLPEIMPWEIADESSVSDSQPLSPSTLEPSPDLSLPQQREDPQSTVEEQQQNATTDSFLSELADASNWSGGPSNDAASAVEASEPEVKDLSSEHGAESQQDFETGLGAGIPSPMPWEQVADASIQISEPESRSPSDPHVALESLLASMREQDISTPVVAAEESTSPAIEIAEPMGFSASTEPDKVDSSAPLSCPMPWEQVADAAMPIPEAESESLLLSSSPSEQILTSPPASVSDSASTGSADSFSLLTDSALPSDGDNPSLDKEPSITESAPNISEDSPRATSFSWNSVFDKAWKLAAGTMAPSPEQDLEKQADSLSASPLPKDSPAPDVAPSITQFSSDAALPIQMTPAMPASFSTVIEEQTIPEVEAAPSNESVSIATGSDVEASQAMSTPSSVEEPPPSKPDESASPLGAPSHWNTGEVEVQVHRPSKKKKRWEKESDVGEQTSPIPAPALESLSQTLSEAIREWKSTPVEATAASLTEAKEPAQEHERPDWMQASDAITFATPASPPPQVKSWSDSEIASPPTDVETTRAVAASAVDVLFSPRSNEDSFIAHEQPAWSKPRPRLMARLHRIRIGISSFVGSCFSTTRSLTFLIIMLTITTAVVMAAAIGALGLAWMAMEVPPSPLYHNLTITPSRVVTDPKKNGYLLLLGFDAPAGQDPVQAGYERKMDDRDLAIANVCMSGEDGKDGTGSAGASSHVVKGWFRSADPAAQIKGQSETIRSLTSRESTALARYQRWLTMPFDDWGYGQMLSPNCERILLAHRLFLLDGFNQDTAAGLDRLEADLQSWRAALGQSKTLMVKMLAATAVQDDASLASGLLSRSDLDSSSLARLSKMVRPLDQVELSVRWPMQSYFVWATKSVASELKQDKSHDRPWHASMAAAMRLPVQRRANSYAEYYEATNKAVAGGRYTNLPKLSTYVRTPAIGLTDYLINPVEHIVGVEPLPSWDPYVMRMIETDARLRLVGLQAWLRRGPQEGDVLMRLAKAGQAYYDPFTGLPMLVNQRKGLIYSVGRDGKDQEGDRVQDVAVTIPSTYSVSSESRRSTSLSLSR